MPSVFPPIVAGSIRELAAKLTLYPSTFEKTVNCFNDATGGGAFDPAEQDGCGTEGLTPPKKPLGATPEHAPVLRIPAPTWCHLHLSRRCGQRAGPRSSWTTENRQANIFAAGEIMAGNILGKGYLADLV